MPQRERTSPHSTEKGIKSLSERLGLDPDYPHPMDFVDIGRLRDPKTGRFVAPCPQYPDHPAPCPESIGSHFGCLWPDYGIPAEAAIAFFDATEKPWSDARARSIVFGRVDGIYLG